jgi:alpha-tubulin suppressor-like RCC1 family protein
MKKTVLLITTTFVLSFCTTAAPSITDVPTCGLTIITHGFQPPWATGAPQWVDQMAAAINTRMGSAIPVYRIRYDKATDSVLIVSGPTLDISLNQKGGAIIVLDWSGVASETLDYPAQDVADKFTTYLFGQSHNGHILAEVPVHLIGHSRGCCLNARIAQSFAGNGILLDQVTTLDPHPVKLTDVPAGYDIIPETYINILFADNYYQPDDFPEGRSLLGAFNQNLTSVLTGIGSEEHMHVHTYYHGTVDINVSRDTDIDGDHIVTSWYDGTLSRDETGFNYSRYTNHLLPRPLNGVNQFISGANGNGSRVLVDDSPLQVWSNAGFDQRSAVPGLATVGQPINIPYYFADRHSQQTITFYTDGDTNPYNGERAQIGAVLQDARPAGSIGTAIFQWTPTISDVGTHYIRIKAANAGGHARYDYFFQPITVQTVTDLTPTITTVGPATLTRSSSPQTFSIYGSKFISPGAENASSVILYDPANVAHPCTPFNVTADSMQCEFAFQQTGQWKVKVVNGTFESPPFSVNVLQSSSQLAGLSIFGPATIAENNTGQFAATAYFSDGGSATVTADTLWSENSSATTISSPGRVSAVNVSSDTSVTISASYTFNGITKNTSANLIVLNTGSGGGSTDVHPIVNGTFEAGSSPWAPSGYAGILAGSYPHIGNYYAYIGNANNAIGSFSQFFPLPAGTTAATLQFYLNIVTAETAAFSVFDTMKVDLTTANEQYVGTIAQFSNLDHGANADGSYVLKRYDITSMISPYKGQSMYLVFSGKTDTNYSTIFRIDDVDVVLAVNNPVSLTGLSIRGPSSILENHGDTLWADAIFSDGTTQTISPNSWTENSPLTTISSDGFLSAGPVTADTTVTVTASYTFNGVTQQASKSVVVLDTTVAHTLMSLMLSGPVSMQENSSCQFTATAVFADGTYQTVTPVWSENSLATGISNDGVLSSVEVANDTTVTVSSSYTFGGITKSASQDVLIINKLIPQFTSLVINGPSSANEQSTAQFSATAFFSDGSSLSALPTWSEDSPATSISMFGLLSAGAVTTDTQVTIAANYTAGGITKNTQKSVTILNTLTLPVVAISAPSAGQGLTTCSQIISGSAGDPGNPGGGIELVQLQVNGGGWRTASGTTSWSISVGMASGNNLIEARSQNSAGSVSATASIIVYVNPPTGYVFFDDMENGQGDWQVFNGPWEITTESSHSPNHSWTDSPGANYLNNQNVSIVTPSIDLTGMTTATLTFWDERDLATGDQALIWAKTDVAPDALLRMYSSTDTGWHQEAVDLSSLAGQRIRLHFQLYSGAGLVADGWHIDDIGVNVLTQYTINSSAGLGGSLSPSGVFIRNAGNEQTFKANPNGLNAVDQWLLDGTAVQSGGNSYTLSNIQGSHMVQVTFTGNQSPGTVIAWGSDFFGQTSVPGNLNNVLSVAAGSYHSLALNRDGTLIAWGNNIYGQTNIPIGISNVVQIVGGAYSSLALIANGKVVGWGEYWNGSFMTPVSVPVDLADVVAIAGCGAHSLALRGDGSVTAWGSDIYGESDVPVDLTNVVRIAAGYWHSIALKADGLVRVWGANILGDGNVPADLTNVVAIAAGYYHNLALKEDGTVVAWGGGTIYNPSSSNSWDYGQSIVPNGLSNVLAIAAGEFHNMALRTDGTVVAWGAGQLDHLSIPFDNTGQSAVPLGLTNVVGIAGGWIHSLALVGTAGTATTILLKNPTLNGTSFTVTLPTTMGKSYMLEYKDSLEDAHWTMLPPVQGDGSLKELTDPSAVSQKRFYRVHQQ